MSNEGYLHVDGKSAIRVVIKQLQARRGLTRHLLMFQLEINGDDDVIVGADITLEAEVQLPNAGAR